jgi:hypothetical protein
MMRTAIISVALTAVMVSATVLADKPEWAGKGGKPTAEQKAAHKDAMSAKQGKGGELEEGKQQKQKKEKNREEKHSREKDKAKEKAGKHQSDKTEREQKELGQGSEEGQVSRENRKKWWKVWGE